MFVNQTGFVDSHVHLNGLNGTDGVLSAGVAALRNAGMKSNAGTAAPKCLHPEKPVVISSCWALCKRGGYGTRFGAPVDTRSEIKAEIRKLKSAGADIIKVMASGMVSFKRPGTVTRGGFNEEDLRFIVEEAAGLGLGVMAHANGEQAISAAAGAGVRSIEHGFFMTKRALDLMARKKIYWTPTVGALIRAAEISDEATGKEEFISGLVGSHLQMLQHAYRIGVPLAVGTDCVLPDPRYAEAYRAELSWFEQAGISSDAVVRIAREGGGRLLGIIK